MSEPTNAADAWAELLRRCEGDHEYAATVLRRAKLAHSVREALMASETVEDMIAGWAEAGAWAHVRASNTEPILRVIAEAPTGALAGDVADAVEGVIGA